MNSQASQYQLADLSMVDRTVCLTRMERSRKWLDISLKGKRVAIVHEWVGERAGSEKVFEAMAWLMPDADLYALTMKPEVEMEFGGREVATTFLDTPWWRNRRGLSLPVMPLAWELLSRESVLVGYDLILSSSHAFSRAFAHRQDTVHLSYVHSPARYVWFPNTDVRSANISRGPLGRLARRSLKGLDLRYSSRTSGWAANSVTTAQRVLDVYGVLPEVIYPPVDVRSSAVMGSQSRSGEFLLAFSRFVPYKRIDDTIRVAAKLGLPLVVAGSGAEEANLRALAAALDVNVEFVISPSSDDVSELYGEAAALLFFANEDFGIIPVEAQAAGCPVVTSGVGGAAETVTDGVSGIHSASPALVDLVEATRLCLGRSFDAQSCHKNAQEYSYERFGERISKWIASSVCSGRPMDKPVSI